MFEALVALNLAQAVAAASMLVLAVLCVRHRRHPPARALAIFFVLGGCWAFCAALIPHLDSLSDKILVNRVKLASAVLISVSILHFALTMHRRRLPRWALATLALIPCFSLLLLSSPEHHTDFVGDYHIIQLAGMELLAFSNGRWFSLHNTQSRILTVVAVALIFRANCDLSRQHRGRAWLINLAIILPLVADTLAVHAFDVLRYLQVTPAFLMLSGISLTYAIFRHRILDLVPFAREQILDGSPDLYLIFDARGRLVDFNRPAARSLALDGRALGRSLLALARDRPGLEALAATPRGGDGSRCQLGGSHYDVEERPVVDARGEAAGSIVILRDMTAQRAIERALEEIAATKTKLLAIVGHDLQGNLASVALAVDNLRRAPHALPKEDLDAALEDIASSTRGLMRFVADLLTWSKSQLGVVRPVRQPVDLQQVVRRVVDFLRPAWLDKGLDVQVESPAASAIESDPNMVEVILRNLLSNAIKASPPEATIGIAIRETDQACSISIDDRGAGLPPEVQANLRDRRSAGGGHGLGLVLCREFCDRLGATLAAEGRGGGGCRVTVTLPRTPPQVQS